MKIDIIFVHFALVLSLIVPFIIFALYAAQERKDLKKRFVEEAKLLNLNLNQKDLWNLNFIGLDIHQQRVLLVQKREELFFTYLVDLKTVLSCTVLYEWGHLKVNKEKEEVLKRVDLELFLQNGTKQIINLYDYEISYVQDYELKHAEKWKSIINASLSLRPIIHTAA